MKIPLIILLLFTSTITAQIQFEDKQYFVAALITDPFSPFAEVKSGFNIGAEFELVSRAIYVRPYIDLYPNLKPS